MTPYQLDSVINRAVSGKPEFGKPDLSKSSMASNKRTFEQTAPYYEDNSLSMSGTFKLITSDAA
jgi:hypothetical protein